VAEYNRLIGVLRKAGRLDAVDPSLAVAASMVISVLRRAYREISQGDIIGVRATGAQCMSPAVAIVNLYTQRLCSLMGAMGLTVPMARLGDRTAQATAEAEDRWGDLLGFSALEGR
jgi:hypothetical protein